ncbi:unnamed protein product, partial [marine sediment metagenome]
LQAGVRQFTYDPDVLRCTQVYVEVDYTPPAPQGLTFDGRCLWESDVDNQLIHQIDPETGRVIRSFAAPGTTPRGLAFDGHKLWYTDGGTNLIYQIDPETGRVIRSFAAPAINPRGLTFDGRTLWYTDGGTK